MPIRPFAARTVCTLAALAAALSMSAAPVWSARPAAAAPAPAATLDDPVLDAREALRRKDRGRLTADRALALAQRHPLAAWADYWELSNRLYEARQDELDAFYARWSGSYVEDRLRNDWLLELGRRRDWANFSRDFPRFRMNDDREVSCYALLVDHISGKPVQAAAVAAWMAQRDLDEGCQLLAATLFDAGLIGPDEVAARLRQAAELNKPRAARAAAGLLGPLQSAAVGEAFDQPARYLARKAAADTRGAAELAALALARLAAGDPDVAADQLRAGWQRSLPSDLAAWAWSQAARNSALKLSAESTGYYRSGFALLDKAVKAEKTAEKAAERAERSAGRSADRAAERSRERPDARPVALPDPASPPAADWSDDTLGWSARSALRLGGPERWRVVLRSIDAMSAEARLDPTWQYWKARALRETARDGLEGDVQRQQAALLLQTLSGQLHFYGKLAAEDLGQTIVLPPRPLPPTAAERDAARDNPGLQRALQLIALGLRNEGVREWNFSLRGMDDRELLAAAQAACAREVWDRCINTSDRTRSEIDLEQRYPMPFREQVEAKAREIGLDPAYVYGLIRQESRFIMDARSQVGASGLMQLMPATARWTAKKIGLPFSADMITDRDINLKLGTNYLKLVLDAFNGSQAMAAAAYNAGPGRPRRWSEGATIDAAIWAENIPFGETRDYVKKVLSNAVVYASLISGRTPSLKSRLGGPIGPASPAASAATAELP